jgi:dUTPase
MRVGSAEQETMKIYVKNTEGVVLPKRGTELSAGYDIVATSDPKIVGEYFIPCRGDNSETALKLRDDYLSSTDASYRSRFFSSIDYIEYETSLYIAPGAVTFHTLILARSSISSKTWLSLANSVGLIDVDYRGQILCRFRYLWQPSDISCPMEGSEEQAIEVNFDKIYKKGDAIAQLVFGPTVSAEFELVDELSQTQRGAGGFGSTTTPPQAINDHTMSAESAKKSHLMDIFSTSEHNLPLPDKNAYLNALREREKQIGQ